MTPRRSLLMLVFVAILSTTAHADVIKASNVSVREAENSLVVNADFRFDLNPRLEDALNQGVPLYFAIDFRLVRPRWYWFDDIAASQQRLIRLVYHTLSGQYRVSRGALYQNFPSLREALRALGIVRDWIVVENEHLQPGADYVAMVRMRLDTTQLPKPFQVSALTSADWTLASNWVRVAFTAKPESEAKP